jgi:quercetin dioxygenase-like cupin family protein
MEETGLLQELSQHRRSFLGTAALALAAVPLGTLAQSNGRRSPMNRTHQLGESAFKAVLPEDIDWQPFAAFPPSVRLAVIVGEPSKPAPYVVRVKVPSGVKLMPHKHPEDRIYTVMSGVFYIGLGEQFDGDKVTAYPPGSVIVLPGDTAHFHWAKSGEYVTQVNAIGPLGLEYLHRDDDPREQNRVVR